jgi:monovalent cation:H+ antiporter-2, CPA2 family
LAGKSLAQSKIRRLTGTTVMAIERDRQLLRYPAGETTLAEGDRLLVVGHFEEHAAFKALFISGA